MIRPRMLLALISVPSFVTQTSTAEAVRQPREPRSVTQVQPEAIHDRDLLLHFLGTWPCRSHRFRLVFLWLRSGFVKGLDGMQQNHRHRKVKTKRLCRRRIN